MVPLVSGEGEAEVQKSITIFNARVRQSCSLIPLPDSTILVAQQNQGAGLAYKDRSQRESEWERA